MDLYNTPLQKNKWHQDPAVHTVAQNYKGMIPGMTQGPGRDLTSPNRQAMAGAQASQNARGGGGPMLSALMGGQMDAANRSALARAGLDAQVQGMQLGNQQYGNLTGAYGTLAGQQGNEFNSKLGLFSQLGNQHNAGQQRQFEQEKAAKVFQDQEIARQHELQRNREAAFFDFTNRYGSTALAASPGGKNGDEIRNAARIQQLGLGSIAGLSMDPIFNFYNNNPGRYPFKNSDEAEKNPMNFMPGFDQWRQNQQR
jgi:hypothetical protein